MKSIALVIVLAAASASAHAGDYGNAAEIERVCTVVAQSSQELYVFRTTQGVTWEMATEGTDPDPNARGAKANMYTVAQAAFSPTVSNQKDAYMRGWALCMDAHRGM